MFGGVVLGVMGAALVFPGAWVATNQLGDLRTPLPATGAGSRFGLLGLAGGLVVAGLTMSIVGGLPPSSPTAAARRWVPSVVVTTGASGLRWRF